MPLVTIRVQNDAPAQEFVADIAVSFYDLSATFHTGGTTDIDGELSVILPDGTYDVCFYKLGFSILPRQPQRIIVSSLLTNIFSVTAHERKSPESIDPKCCTISGYILGINGKRTKSRLVFSPVKELMIIDGQIIDLLSRVEVASDDEGYFEFELLRGQTYLGFFLYIESFLDIVPPASVKVIVPDRPSIELDRLLFPVPIAAEFSDTTRTLFAAADNDESMTVDLRWSDGSCRWESYAWVGLRLIATHPEVAEFCIYAGQIVVKPLSPGVATLSIDRVLSDKVVFDPVDTFLSDILTVTVVP